MGHYRIYSINRPGRLLNFWNLRVGAYSRLGWALIKFSPFSASEVCLFCNKTINASTKRQEVTKQGFCKILWRKLRPRKSLLLKFIHSSGWAPHRLGETGYGNTYHTTLAQNAETLPNPRRTGERSLSSFNMASKGNSVFSRIIRRELPATFLHEDDQVNQERCVSRTVILHRLHSHL